MKQLGATVNLVICQKSKIDDWVKHFEEHYDVTVCDLTKKGQLELFLFFNKQNDQLHHAVVGVINYELAFRRPELLKLKNFTLMLDESSMIQNEQAKRTKFIMKLNPDNIILLSGTPTSGKYERLWTQLHLLGWNISKNLFWNQYVDYYYYDNQGFPIKIVRGYKNVDRLIDKMHEYGCQFMKSDEVFDLPEQVFNEIRMYTTAEYRTFKKKRIVTVGETEFVGDTTLTKMLYERMLCGAYNKEKLQALKDIFESTDERIVVFYNFNEELKAIEKLCEETGKPVSWINGQTKDLIDYANYKNCVVLVQYQAGAMGLNLQLANKMVFFTPTLSCELWMQSLKRIHRIGQNNTCFYYKLICKNSIEEKIYKALETGVDYTNKLFEKDDV